MYFLLLNFLILKSQTKFELWACQSGNLQISNQNYLPKFTYQEDSTSVLVPTSEAMLTSGRRIYLIDSPLHVQQYVDNANQTIHLDIH